MARKWLSGALAFAMIFGCSAPVALAEETPVEVVEVEQESLEDVEQYAINAPEFVKSSYQMVAKEGEKVEMAMTGINETPTKIEFTIRAKGGSEVDLDKGTHAGTGSQSFTGSWDADKQVLTVTATDKINPDVEQYTVTAYITFGDEGEKAYTATIKATKPEAALVPTVTVNGTKMSTDTVTEKIGQGTSFDVEFTNKGTESKKPYSVSYTLGTDFDKYVAVSKKDEDDKTTYTLKGVNPTAKDKTVGILFNVVWNEGDDAKSYEVLVGVTGETFEVSGINISRGKASITNNESTNIIAQAKYVDQYGREQDFDGAAIFWSIDGKDISGNGTYKDADDKELFDYSINGAVLTITGKNAGAGTYTIEAESANGKTSSTTITITSNAAPASIAVKETDAGTYLPAGQVDLNGLTYTITMDDGNKYSPADINAKLDFEVTGVDKVAKGAGKVESISIDVDKLVKVENGVVTIAAADDANMEKALKELTGEYNALRFNVQFSVNGHSTVKGTICFYVATAAEDVDRIVVTDLNDKEIAFGDTLVMTVGEDYKLNVKVVDKLGFTGAIDQNVGVYVYTKNPLDNNVYGTASYNKTTGELVVKPTLATNKGAQLVIVSAADPAKSVMFDLLVLPAAATTPTPEPSPTAAPSPTTEPSTTPEPSPTAAPVVRTGVVVNVSSNLNIRAAANTSSTVVTKVKNGTNLVILGEEGNFYKVQLADGTIGYASKDYVRETTDTPVQPTGDYAIVTTKGGRLNMRQTAGGAVITSIANGTRVDVISEGSEWTLIEYNGRQGYVSTGFLTIYHGAVG